MDRSNQASQVHAKFILCAFPDQEFEHTWDPADTEAIEDLHSQLANLFGIDDENFRLLFHPVDEPCWIRRPHTDLFGLYRDRLNGEILCLHPYLKHSGSLDWQKRRFSVSTALAVAKNGGQRVQERQPEQTRQSGTGADIAKIRSDGSNSKLPQEENPGQDTNPEQITGVSGSTNTDERDIPAELKLHVSFELCSATMKLDPIIWKDIDEELQLRFLTMEDIFTSLRGLTLERLEKDTGLLKRKKYINVLPSLQLSDEISRCADLDQYGNSHVLNVSDLFKGPNKDARLPIRVVLSELIDQCRSGDADEMLVGEQDNDCDYYRVGDVKVSDNDDVGGIRRAPQQHAVIAWYRNEDKKEPRGLQLSLVPTWNVDGNEIGDCDLGQPIKNATIPKDTVMYGRYGSNANKQTVHKLLSSGDADKKPIIADLRTRIPKAFTHCFNDSRTGKIYTGLEKWPEKQDAITVKGPFVHYKGNRRDENSHIPYFFNIKVKEEHDLEDIYSLLDGELRRRVGGKKHMEKRFKNKERDFKYDLWVLPQVTMTGVRKMFRYKKGKVTQFMSERGVKVKEDVYMEVHVVPMEVDDK